jgi:hypothetical protein
VKNGGAGMGRLFRRTSGHSVSARRRPSSPDVTGPPPETQSPTLFVFLLFQFGDSRTPEVGDGKSTLIMYASGVLFANFQGWSVRVGSCAYIIYLTVVVHMVQPEHTINGCTGYFPL